MPATVCTGYIVAWTANLNDFRSLTMVERIFWSVPLSLCVSTISSILIGRFLSLEAVVILLFLTSVLCAGVVGREWFLLRRAGQKIHIGLSPLGAPAFLLALVWVALAIGSLIDIQSDHGLFASLTIFDHSMRVSWTESVMRAGVPPMNPLYMDGHPAPMRYYYFWYVLCAAIAKMWHLSARSVMIASCVWAGFFLVALAGLYTKYFLGAGSRTRRQLLTVAGLLTVTGLGVWVNLWNILHLRQSLPGALEIWKVGQITSWFNSLLWVPHHVASMICCMFGFLLAWIADHARGGNRAVTILLIGAAFASAFGLSIYVAFAFFLVMLVWILWQVIAERSFQSSITLASGGAVAFLLLIPYLLELLRGSSAKRGGSSVFSFAIRETIPPEALLATSFFQHLAGAHPFAARNLANLILLAPGYAVELGFYGAVLLIYLIPAWRGRTRLTPPQRSLVCISVATLVIISFLRSTVIESNDFGWRGALLAQFCLLLLASELLTSWNLAAGNQPAAAGSNGLPGRTPQLVQALASFALIFGAMTTLYQALMVRFTIPLREAGLRSAHDPRAGTFPHKAYISAIGYEQLSQRISPDAIVQYNPWSPDPFWIDPDWLGAAHQSVIDSDQGVCGAEFGGDPAVCPAMAGAIDALYSGATAEQARTTCHELGIQYLIARVYDPVWSSKDSWVWTLRPVVADEDFRAVDCRPDARAFGDGDGRNR